MPLLTNGTSRLLGGRGSASPIPLTNLALWLKADAITANDGDAVASWTSSDVGAYAFAQGTAGAKPTYKTNIINGKPVVRFDGGDLLDNTTFVMDLRERTMFFVVRETTPVVSAGVFVIKPAAGNDYSRTDGLECEANTGDLYWAGSTGYGLGSDTNKGTNPLGILCERKTAGRGDVYMAGGTAVASDTVFTEFAAASGGGALIGGRFMSGTIQAGYRLKGDVAEIIVYSARLDAANTNIVGAYLATKYGLTWNNTS